MFSIEHCRKKLEKYGKKYTDEQVKDIRELLYFFAKLDGMNYEAEKLENNTPLLNVVSQSK